MDGILAAELIGSCIDRSSPCVINPPPPLSLQSALAATPGPYFLEQFSIADVVFTPYIERMAASLFFYKGFVLRDPQKHPRIFLASHV